MARQRYFSDYGRASARPSEAHVVPYLAVAVLALIGLLLMRLSPPPVTAIHITGRVLDGYTGQPIAGARVAVLAAGPDQPTPGNSRPAVAITQPVTVAGVMTNTAAAAPASLLQTITAADGSWTFGDLVAQDPLLLIEQTGYDAQQVVTAGRAGDLEVRLQPNTLHGTVTNAAGHPVAGATVAGGGQVTTTASDGTYLLSNIGTDHHLMVKAPGYTLVRTEFANTTQQNVALKDPFNARAIYVNADSLAAPGKLLNLIKLANDTEINAMVIDVKADTTGFVLYNSALPQVQAAGASNPVVGDLRGLIDSLHKNGIYVIARQALFWDEKLAAAHPEWAIHSKSSGTPWVDAYGHHWVNAYRPEVWAYNIAIAKEVGSLGADEVQFDYVRFPSDGNLADTDYGVPDSQPKAGAISSFLAQAYTELSREGVFVSADVFGLSPIVKDDLGIGQQFDELVKHVDYISPMAYPSHYANGFLGFDKPAEHPSEVLAYTLHDSLAKMLRSNARLRPWLQDFTLGGVVYDASRVRGQIEVCEANDTAGWMLWNFDNVYTQDALKK
ncbi:MAG TPA: putative glycoside hydrolase [Chloroflexia bacterium]|nr:putative glycoside hydrolase [Chloroflexia bacterium]